MTPEQYRAAIKNAGGNMPILPGSFVDALVALWEADVALDSNTNEEITDIYFDDREVVLNRLKALKQ